MAYFERDAAQRWNGKAKGGIEKCSPAGRGWWKVFFYIFEAQRDGFHRLPLYLMERFENKLGR